MSRMEEVNPRLWYAAVLSFTSLFYILLIIFAVLLIFYTKPDDCTENKVFISLSLIFFCVAVSILSILPKVQEHQPRSGLLQSSIIAVYTLCLTWSAMSNEPERSCNPSLMGVITHLTSPTVSPANSTALAPACAPPSQNGHLMNLDDIWGLITFVFCLLYPSIYTSSNSQVNKLTLSGNDSVILGDTTSGASDEDGQPRWAVDSEKEGCSTATPFFRLMLCCASLYIMMTITSWNSPDAKFQKVSSEWLAVWIKMGSSWVCLLLYCRTLVAPLVLTGRDLAELSVSRTLLKLKTLLS